MAGILPIAEKDGKLFFLLSRETINTTEWKGRGKWSDFGGKREKGETLKTTALREGFEETMGILGSIKDLNKKLNEDLVKKYRKNNYTTYVFKIKYEKNLPKKFRRKYINILKTKKHLITEPNGLYEKDMIKWVPVCNIENILPKMRIWYKSILITISKDLIQMV